MVVTPNAAEFAPAGYLEIYDRHTTTPALARPQDIANLVVFLASDDARYLNGQVYYADGGIAAVNPIVADFSAFMSGERSRSDFERAEHVHVLRGAGQSFDADHADVVRLGLRLGSP